MKKLDSCVVCGLPASEHHIFIAREVPDNCVCDFDSWQDTPGPICDSFKGDENSYCEKCEHDQACHKKNEN